MKSWSVWRAELSSILPVVFMIIAGLGLLAALVALWHSARAAMDGGSAPGERRVDPGAERASLLEQKQMLLRSLKDLELEHELGKLSDADYERLKEHYRGQARHVLRDLDDQTQPHREQARRLVEGRVERALGKKGKREDAKTTASEGTDARPEQAVAERALQCAECDTCNDPDAAFCKKCGARLEAASMSVPAAERGTA